MTRLAHALTYVSIVSVLLTACPVQAQYAARPAGVKAGSAITAPDGTAPSGSLERLRLSLENERKQIATLRRRKNFLEKYLSSVSRTSADYKVTEGEIQRLDAALRIQEEKLKEVTATVSHADGLSLKVSAAAAKAEGASSFRGGAMPAPEPNAFPRHPAPVPQATTGSWQGLTLNLVEVIQTKIDQTSNTKQTEAPSESENSTSLVDQSSASDLIGVALNLAGLSAQSNDDKEADNVSVTASAYSVYSALQGADPLNPVFYNENRPWRRVFFTLGYDDEKVDGTETTERSKIYGVKVMLVDKRDPGLYSADFDRVRQNATAAGSVFVSIRNRAIAFLYNDARVRPVVISEFKTFLDRRRLDSTVSAADRASADQLLNEINSGQKSAATLFLLDPNNRFTSGSTLEERLFFADFNNRYISPGPAGTPVATLDPNVLRDLQKFLDDEVTGQLSSFATLDAEIVSLIKKIRKAPQFSFYFLTKQREKSVIDDYVGELIYDYGLGDRVNLTLNGAFEYKNSRLIGGDSRGGKFAGQLQFRVNKAPESLVGKKPLYFFLATNNKWRTGVKPVYMGQAKLMVPIADGFDIPLSLTFANRSELNKEKFVRGQFGLTFDTARLLRAFLSK